jgi:hypothetical protein
MNRNEDLSEKQLLWKMLGTFILCMVVASGIGLLVLLLAS